MVHRAGPATLRGGAGNARSYNAFPRDRRGPCP